MRRRLLALGLALASVTTASAQTAGFLKPVIGVNYATATAKDLTVRGARPGFTMGLMVEGKLKQDRHLSAEAGIQYSHSRIEILRNIRWQPYINPGDWQTREEVLMRFVRVPVALIYRFSKPYPFFAGAGTALQFNITTTRNGNETSNQLLDKPYSGRFAMNSTLGIPIGLSGNIFVGKEFNLGAAPGGLRLDYTLDATGWKYPTAGDYERDEPYSLRNSGLSLMAWIKVGGKKSEK